MPLASQSPWLYALHSDSDLDAKKIYHTLSSNPELEKNTMSVAEKLKAEGRVEGISKGLWVGRIQSLQEFLGLPIDPCGELERLALEELEIRHADLHREYELRFKRH